MWSFFSRDPAKDFHYEIGEKIPGLEDRSIWTLHHGKKKGSGDPVTVFAFDVKSSSESQVQVAKGAFKRIKTLRHPNFVTFLDGVETDKVIYFATEPVVPLENFLTASNDNRNELAISWGLHQVAKGLSFLVNDCNLIHNNVCMAAIFVDIAGDWKIGGVEYMYPTQGQESVPPVKILPVLEKYDPPEKTDIRRRVRGEKWSTDMWGLGCLIWEVFNGPLTQTSALKNFGKIAKPLVPNYCELVGANPKSRPNPSKFLEKCKSPKGFMDNSFVKTMLFMEEIQIKDQSEKTKFFGTLAPSLDSFPAECCKNKILPQLLNAFEYGDAGSAVLAPLFKIGKLLSMDEYQKKIVPCVVKLFSSTDRATRVKLLQQIDTFIEYLQPDTVNAQIFPHIIHGFTDTNPVVRESTIKAMLFVAPKLNHKNLNEEVMKHFARLQSKDDQGGIRTNTTVCLGKIACYLNPQVRQKMISSAFLRAMKDPFPPARQAGILGMATTQNFFTLNEIAHRLLPALCTMTRDPESTVREQAFKSIKGFISKLEKVSDNPDLEAEMEKDVLSGGSLVSSSAASWAGWAVGGMSSITSKLYKKGDKAKNTTELKKPLSGASPSTPVPESQPTKQVASNEHVQSNLTEPDQGVDQEVEGWDDEDWGDIESSPVSSPTTTSAPSRNTDGWDNNDDEDEEGDEDDDDNWESLEDTKPKNRGSLKLDHKPKKPDDWGDSFGFEFESTDSSGLQPASDYNWGETNTESNQDDFFSSAMGLPTKKTQSAIQSKTRTSPPRSTSSSSNTSSARASPARNVSSQKQKQSNSDSGWGVEDSGWGTDDWGNVGSTNKTTVQTRQKQNTRKSPPQSHGAQQTGSGTSSAGWESGWGEEDTDWGSMSSGTNKLDEAQRKKEEREEKRRQRQQELQEKREAKKGGGALKLGAKKLAAD
ncbi:hypothetical protein FSP39_005381 [Pinctada imbricata]|uniref:N-terminal kinase-like protein n=1 Tax=Pinctada imbricata TaxID=66713 RepID=A0AA89BRB9_PINIB|nr:hypothetical protein FSP39_005381 [Pinctada imbricata]